MTQTSFVQNAIIGAGPYGLSAAAHLRYNGVPFRIFGLPMHRWRYQMPQGMYLKSEGRASSLSEPTGRYTLKRFCAERGLPYDDRAMPVSIETFIEYAMSFQRRYVPGLENVLVRRVEWSGNGFDLLLDTGERIRARNVIVATGLDHTAHIPPVFSQLPASKVSHCEAHRDLTRYRNIDVTVIGAGQSALETAALLAEIGARVRVLARRNVVAWNEPPRLNPSLWRRLRFPVSDLGEGLQHWFFCKAPRLFRYLPQILRIYKVKTMLDAAGAYWLRGRVEGTIEILTGREVRHAKARNGRVVRFVGGCAGPALELETDHVIVGTGYHYDLRNLPFLSEDLKESIHTEDGRPALSTMYESTVPGLYFAGMSTAYTFGPSMRFVAGVGYFARTVADHLGHERQIYTETESREMAAVSN